MAVLIVLFGVVVGAIAYEVGRSSGEHRLTKASAPSSTTTTTSRATTTSSSIAPGPAGAFAGYWYHHGFNMGVAADGQGQAVFRLYTVCGRDPAPCDVV